MAAWEHELQKVIEYGRAKKERELSKRPTATEGYQHPQNNIILKEEFIPKPSEPKMGGGLRYNNGKAELHQVPSSLNFAVAKCLQYGAQKYEKGNWRKGMSWTTVYDCLQRHSLKWLDGEANDDESGLPHLYHMACNVAFLIEYAKTCPELDDRFQGEICQAGVSFDSVEFNEFKKES